MSLVHRLILVVCDMDVVPHLSTLTIGRLPVEPASREGHSGFLLSGWLLLEPHTSAVGRFNRKSSYGEGREMRNDIQITHDQNQTMYEAHTPSYNTAYTGRFVMPD